MITKKDIPLNILKSIEPIVRENLDIIKLKKEENSYYTFVEHDEKSNYLFRIFIDGRKVISNADNSKFVYQWKPQNSSNYSNHTAQSNLEILIESLKKWILLVREINETPSIHDDNFLEKYSKYYYDEIKILDDDANYSPFNPKQQEFISHYLISLKKKIESSSTQIEKETIIELTTDITKIETTLEATTKQQVIKSIAKVYGKLYKTSRQLAKKVFEEAVKQFTSKFVEYGIDYGNKAIEIITSTL